MELEEQLKHCEEEQLTAETWLIADRLGSKPNVEASPFKASGNKVCTPTLALDLFFIFIFMFVSLSQPSLS